MLKSAKQYHLLSWTILFFCLFVFLCVVGRYEKKQ